MSIEEILNTNKIIAIIGFSNNHMRPSNRIGRYMKGNGYKVYGINPRFNNEQEVDDICCYPVINALPEKADIINIFRRSEFVYDLVKEILELDYKPKVIWTQIGVISNDAKQLAESSSIIYIENKCIMVEHNKI